MQVAALSSAVLVWALVMMLLRGRAVAAERLRARIEKVSRIGAAAEVPDELNLPFRDRFLKPAAAGLVKRLAGILPQTENPRLAASLRQAGISMRPREYNAMRIAFSAGAGIAGALLAVMAGADLTVVLCALPGGAALGLVMLRFLLRALTRSRKQAIQKQLPEVLDLLSVSVEAGLAFDAALQRISGRTKGTLIDELKTTCREMALGRPRAEALRGLDARCGLEEVRSFVGAVIQAEQLGISLKNVLRSQAQQMRLIRRQRVEERAMKAPVKIIFPLVLFVFPVLFIILLGPAVISIAGTPGVFGG